MTQVRILESLIKKQAQKVEILQLANTQKDQTIEELTQRLNSAELNLSTKEQEIDSIKQRLNKAEQDIGVLKPAKDVVT